MVRLGALVLLIVYGHGLTPPDDQCFCDLKGSIDDCCCSIEDVNRLNQHVLPLVERLSSSSFFKFYRVNMNKPCRFWQQDAAECGTNTCAVQPCGEVGTS